MSSNGSGHCFRARSVLPPASASAWGRVAGGSHQHAGPPRQDAARDTWARYHERKGKNAISHGTIRSCGRWVVLLPPLPSGMGNVSSPHEHDRWRACSQKYCLRSRSPLFYTDPPPRARSAHGECCDWTRSSPAASRGMGDLGPTFGADEISNAWRARRQRCSLSLTPRNPMPQPPGHHHRDKTGGLPSSKSCSGCSLERPHALVLVVIDDPRTKRPPLPLHLSEMCPKRCKT